MPGFVEPKAFGGMRPLRERLPVAAELLQSVVAEPAEQHIVRARILGVELKAVAFKHLGEKRALGGLLLFRRGDRIAEDGQATV